MREWLKERRKEKRMTMVEVAKQAGISQSYYSDIENGKRDYNIPVATATAIALVLGFPWEWFYGEDMTDRREVAR